MIDDMFHPQRLRRLEAALEADIARGLCSGAVALVARHGTPVLHAAFGTTSPTGQQALRVDHVFSLFSLSKAFTNALVFQAIERGAFSLSSRIAELIPECQGHGRDMITVAHLLTHCSGLPPLFTPRRGMYIDRLEEVVAAIAAGVHAARPPGEEVCYSPMIAHALLGEAVRRADDRGRRFSQIAEEEIFRPLQMTDTCFGVRPELRSRHIVSALPVTDPPMEHLGHSDYGPNGAFEEQDAQMPWVGAVSSAGDLFRFAEMLRRGGELDGKVLLSRALLEYATRNQTGERVNTIYTAMRAQKQWAPWPAYFGLGFQLRGTAICPHHFGALASAGTFGHTGFGSSLLWVDPERDTTFICLTAGVIREADNIERFQRLSDLVHSAVR